jgi:hypothetical protein
MQIGIQKIDVGLFELLLEDNKIWTRNTSVLIVVVVSYRYFEYNGKSSPIHQFDIGATYENLL